MGQQVVHFLKFSKMGKAANDPPNVTKSTFVLLCLSGQEMAPTGQGPLLKDSWCQNSILSEEQLADPTIFYITSVNVMYSSV